MDQFSGVRSIIALEGKNSSTFIAALLGYYFGLRISEVCNLRIGDVWFENSLTIYIWNTKRKAYRSIQCNHLPLAVQNHLQMFKQVRLQTANLNNTAPFLLNSNHNPLTRQTLTRKINSAFSYVETKMGSCIYNATFHTLRHACANRWLEIGMPLNEISNNLGHISMITTIENYLHIFHFLQAKQLQALAFLKNDSQWTKKAVAAMLCLTPRHSNNIIAECSSNPAFPENCAPYKNIKINQLKFILNYRLSSQMNDDVKKTNS